ncbi:hypothetical protein QL285_096339 [Trifolium repens]|nr:hypothetical protein QL285_096339 [Trifolium repens]
MRILLVSEGQKRDCPNKGFKRNLRTFIPLFSSLLKTKVRSFPLAPISFSRKNSPLQPQSLILISKAACIYNSENPMRYGIQQASILLFLSLLGRNLSLTTNAFVSKFFIIMRGCKPFPL